MPGNWRGVVERLPRFADEARGWGRVKLSALSQAEWRRYAAIAIILTSVMIEIFVFGGANTLLMSDQSRLTVATQQGAAESFLDPLPAPAPQTTGVADSVAKPVKQANTARKARGKTANEKELAHEEARVAKRTVTYRTDTGNLRPPEAKASEPPPPGRNSESNIQLNVKWEN